MEGLVKSIADKIIKEDGATITYKRDSKWFSWIVKKRWLRRIPLVNTWLQRFYFNYTTTINKTIFLGENFDQKTLSEQITTLKHESKHIKQAKKYGFFLFALAYLFLPIPFVFAYCRARLEWEAYQVQINHMLNLHYPIETIEEYLFKQYCTSTYFWMWPWKSSIRKWLRKLVNARKK